MGPLGMIINNWDFITAFFSNLWGGVTQIFSTTWENIKSSFNGVIDFIQKPFEDFFNWIASKFEWVNGLIGGTVGFFSDIGSSIGDGLKTASNFFKVDKEKEKDYMVFDEKQKENTGLNYKPLPADKKDVIGANNTQQTNHIQVTVNNSTSTVDVQKGIQDGLANKKSSTNLSDQEF